MALTQTTSLDIVGQTSTISFYDSATLVDQFTYANNQVTFQAISSYNLTKSDMLLYVQYKQIWNQILLSNFNLAISQVVNKAFPLCNFQLSNTFQGVTHITYNETSQGNTVTNFNYVPISGSVGVTARASPVTVSMQEFEFNILMISQYYWQVYYN